MFDNRIIADELNINECTIQQIVTEDLNMRKLCAKIVPKGLNDDQKACPNDMSAEMLEQLETELDFLNRVIIYDERWFFEYDPEIKRQSEEWNAPQSTRKRKVRMSKSKIKKIVIIFFCSRVVVHKESELPGVTLNHKYYLEVLDRLRNMVMQVRKEITDDWIHLASSRQRTLIHSTISSRISDKKLHSRIYAGSLFSGFVTW
jgi:hypothetical protein